VAVELLPNGGHESDKFAQLCAVVARELGYGELSAFSVVEGTRGN
jgi:hypothetical protein